MHAHWFHWLMSTCLFFQSSNLVVGLPLSLYTSVVEYWPIVSTCGHYIVTYSSPFVVLLLCCSWCHYHPIPMLFRSTIHIYHRHGKIHWARFQPYEVFRGNTFAVYSQPVFITYLQLKIHGKTFAVSSKTANVQPSESFHVYSIHWPNIDVFNEKSSKTDKTQPLLSICRISCTKAIITDN